MRKIFLRGVMVSLVLLLNLGGANIKALANVEKIIETKIEVAEETKEQEVESIKEQELEKSEKQEVESTEEQQTEETINQVEDSSKEQINIESDMQIGLIVEETTENNEESSVRNFSVEGNNSMAVVNTVKFYLDENKVIKYSEERSGSTNQIVRYYEYF